MQSRPVRASRRSFIKGLAVTTGGLVVPRVFWAQEGGPASRKLGIAAIGCGGKGDSDLNAAARGNNVVAICDVDSRSLAKAAGRYPGAKQYADFRQMLDEVKEIDAVTISTSDHAHFPAAMHAIALGKHVCVQKPLANTLWELREMHLAATKKGVITQMGNQGHTYNANRMLKEWLDAGVVGKAKEIHVWTNRPIWPQGKAAGFKPDDVPDYLNWPLSGVWGGGHRRHGLPPHGPHFLCPRPGHPALRGSRHRGTNRRGMAARRRGETDVEEPRQARRRDDDLV
jgi:hypothetical protein